MNKTKLRGPGISAWLSVAALVPGMIGCSDEGSETLKIETGGPPAYVAVRDRGAAEWTALDVAGKSSFEVKVAAEYEAVILCESAAW